MKTKREAADFLGIGVRTLERYAQKGQISHRFEKGRRRPRVVFDDADLQAFKERLDESRAAQPAEAASPTAMRRIGFRLDPHYLQRLTEEGARADMSPGEYARRLVIGALEDFSRDEIRATQSSIHDEMVRLREDLADWRGARADAPTTPGETADGAVQPHADLAQEVSLLRTALEQMQPGATLTGLAQVQAELRKMREELIKAVQVILLNIFEDKSEEDVRNFVQTVFTPQGAT